MLSQETGLYYLQSRYYNPEMGRFINADAFASTGQGLLGNNMFAYCNNNPIIYCDETGTIHKFAAVCYDGGGAPFEPEVPREEIDRQNYIAENTDPNLVFGSTFFSAYKGALVIRHNNDFLTSWSLFGTIFLNHNTDTYNFRDEVLNHEYGHFCQEMLMSTPKYVVALFIPSSVYNLLSRNSKLLNDNYYNMPWEYDADVRGGVNRNHAAWASFVSEMYFALWGVI